MGHAENVRVSEGEKSGSEEIFEEIMGENF